MKSKMNASKMEKRDNPEVESLLQYLRGKKQNFTVYYLFSVYYFHCCVHIFDFFNRCYF